jgi:hypothetical protein
MTNVAVAPGATAKGRRLSAPKEWPLLVLNQPGLGKSVYFAADMGQAYFIAPYQYQRRLFSNAVKWAAGANQPPVRVEAPLCVQAAFYTQQEGRRTVVHLLNEANTTANRALPFNNPSEREETLPVFDIKVSFHGLEVSSAYQEPEHLSLPVKKIADGEEVTVPRLDVHSMVVVSKA